MLPSPGTHRANHSDPTIRAGSGPAVRPAYSLPPRRVRTRGVVRTVEALSNLTESEFEQHRYASATRSPDNPSWPGGRPTDASVSALLRQPAELILIRVLPPCCGNLSPILFSLALSVCLVGPVHISTALLNSSSCRISPGMGSAKIVSSLPRIQRRGQRG